MGTVCPSSTLICVIVPADGEGMTVSTLSVEISSRGSSRSTFSPTFLSHLVTVPSAIDSPIWGMTTSVAIFLLPRGTRTATAGASSCGPLERHQLLGHADHVARLGQEELFQRLGQP